jgi:hypothetical protein
VALRRPLPHGVLRWLAIGGKLCAAVRAAGICHIIITVCWLLRTGMADAGARARGGGVACMHGVTAVAMTRRTQGLFNGVYTYTAEIFPTSLRSSGLGLCNVFARCGGILAPQALQLGQTQMSLAFACLALLSCGATLLLPETLGRALV